MEQEQLTETYQKFNHDLDRNEINERYHEYLLLGYRNYYGPLNDLVCSYEGEERYTGSYRTRHITEGA